jgi:transcriptional regulator with XRE-family HTH domain
MEVTTGLAAIAMATSSLDLEGWGRPFATCLREVRLRLGEKQMALSYEVGCSDAAVSLWESRTRLPTARNLHRLLNAIATWGATTDELLSLRAAWYRERALRSQLGTFAEGEESTSRVLRK